MEVKIALEESMVEVHVWQLQLIKLLLLGFSVSVDYMRKEIFHLCNIIHKDLQKMLDIDLLFLLELKVLVVVRCETLSLITLVLNQGIDDLLNEVLQLVYQPVTVIVTHCDTSLPVSIVFRSYGFK